MPADDRFGFDDHQHILPACPRLPQDGPEQPVQRAERRPGPPPLQDRDLLAQREDLQRGIVAAPEVGANGDEDCEHERDHGLTVVTRSNVLLPAELGVQRIDSRGEEVVPTYRSVPFPPPGGRYRVMKWCT